MIELLKFFHVIFAVGVLGLTTYCFAAVNSKHFNPKINKTLLIVSLLALMSGTLLVHPKHFTFHTPWIQAAYIFMIIFSAGVIFLWKNNHSKVFQRRILYLILIIILLAIAHDAITKTTSLL